MSDDDGIDRRKFMAGLGAVGVTAALAGCEAEEGEGTADGSSDGSTSLTPPSAPPVPEDEYWAYVVESLEYQNQMLEQIAEE